VICDSRGVALVITLLAINMVSALALGLVLTTTADRTAVANHDAAIDLLNAADAALELSARDLAAISNWNDVLRGRLTSTLVDGSPGLRSISPGETIDLVALGNVLSCGRAGGCSDAQVRVTTGERPWGANNPRWRPFLHVWLAPPAPLPRDGPRLYVVVWIGDDARETDGDPGRDGAGPGGEGRYIVRARVEAFGPGGARRAIEADLARVCDAATGGCAPGVRVHSWRAMRPPAS
jgi:hypothetical protein